MLLKSLNYWSLPGGLEGTLDPVEATWLAKEAGFDAIELAIGEAGTSLGVDADAKRTAEIKQSLDALDMPCASVASGLYWGRSLGDADPAKRAQAKDDLKSMIRIASELGAKTLLTIPGAVEVFFLPDRPVEQYDEVHRWAVEGLKEVLPTAAEYKVRLGIENVWNKFLLSPTEMAWFIDSFESEWIGSYLDVANILPYGFPEQWLRILGSRVVGVHFKDYRRAVGTIEGFVDLLEGDVNWPAVMEALKAIEYSGPVAAEMIPQYRHHPLVRVQNTSRAMDAILAR